LAPAPASRPAAVGATADAFAHALSILAPRTGPIALAVSGGSDSTALLLLAHDWRGRTGRPLIAATVDHGLRPEAAAEAETVGSLCGQLGVAHTTLRWRPEAERVSQADARIARHRLLASWARAAGASALALGHTSDDRIETFLIRARAGSTWRGLAGPAPRGPSPAWPEGAGLSLIRPALGCWRDGLRAELVARGASWIDDPSNSAERYERVRMRGLAGCLTPATRGGILRTMDRFATLRAAALAAAEEGLAVLVRPGAPAACALEADGFRRMGALPRLLLVEALVLAAGGAPGPLPSHSLARLHETMIRRGALERAITLAGARIEEKGDSFLFSQAPPRRGNPGQSWGFTMGLAPALARAAGLLADPALAAIGA
jgi:tRNA(Ile)-lysidine synthase